MMRVVQEVEEMRGSGTRATGTEVGMLRSEVHRKGRQGFAIQLLKGKFGISRPSSKLQRGMNASAHTLWAEAVLLEPGGEVVQFRVLRGLLVASESSRGFEVGREHAVLLQVAS